MSKFTDKEKQVLVQFRDQLKDLNLDAEKNTDGYLIRWLRARDLNIPKAESMLRASIKWREANKIDDLLNWEAPKIFSEIYPMEICGFDKSGCPIVVCPSRYFDINEFWKCDKDDYLRYATQSIEKVMKVMRDRSTREHPITEFIAIYDLEGFNFRAIMNRQYYEFMQDSSKYFNDNYPEAFHKAYFVFAPKLFSVVWAMIKHVIPKRSLDKYQIHGFNKEKWRASMLEHIDEDQIPPRFGGTNFEFEKTAFANANRKRAEGCGPNQIQAGIDNSIFVKVPAGKKHTIDYDIEVLNSKISWIFKTESCDISFAVTFESEEMIPNSRVDSGVRKQVGGIICEKTGRYSLIFDNMYSRMRAKSLHICVKITTIEVVDLEESSNCTTQVSA